MKLLFLPLAALAVAVTALAAPVPVTGTMIYTQNFDAALGTGSFPVWVNDSTVPGWYAQINNGNTATGSVQAADGMTVLSGLLNLGTTAATDRALGSKATGVSNLANIAYAVIFENRGNKPVALSQVNYTGELWRTNSGTGTPVVPVNEEFTVFYQVSGSVPASIYSGATGPGATAGAGFTAFGAGADWTSPVNSPAAVARDGNNSANRTAVSFPVTGIKIPPGQFVTIKWTDANEAGTDGFQGLDDVSVFFTEIGAVLTPAASVITRDANGTPALPADDFFGFTVNVSVSGTGFGAGWNAATVTPPDTNQTSGAYGTDVTWTGFPVASPKTVTFTDSGNVQVTADLTLIPPGILGTNVLANNNVITSGAIPAQWILDESRQSLTMNNGGGTPAKAVNTAAVNLSSVTGNVKFSAVLDVKDTSSGFEAVDTFLAQLILNDGAGDTVINLITPFDTDASGSMNGAELAPAGGTVAAPVLRSYALSHIIPDNIISARLSISGNNDSTNETLTVSGIIFESAPPPLRYTIGWRYDGTTLTDVLSDAAVTPAAEWINDPVLHALNMTTGGTTDKIVASEMLDLRATGTVHFSALFRARETSVGSNFETTDRFKAELIIDGGLVPANVINLVSPWDTGDGAPAVGTGGGPNGPPNGYLNGYSGITVAPSTALQDYNNNRVRDEFNNRGGGETGDTTINNTFALSAVIPAAANSVQLRVYGTGISGSEFFTVSQVFFSIVAPSADTDGDGVTDLKELIDGTDPHDSISVFTISSLANGPGGAQVAGFPTVAGRIYRGYFSTGLATWRRDDSVPAVTGDGTVKSWTLPVLAAPAGRHYLKVLTGFSATDFPLTLP